MPFASGPRIRETSNTTGAGTYTLAGAPAGYQAFSVLGANSLCKYFATDGTNWEEGIGTVLTGPARLARTHILGSSNGGAAVNWGAGTRTLRCGPIAAMDLPRALSKSVAGGAGTTVLTQDEQRRHVLEFTGALTGNRILEVDATPWQWVVYNNTSGAFTVTVRVTGQTGVVVPQGRRALLACDGVDVRAAAAMSAGGVSEFPAGTAMVFQQTAAPVGWTKSTTHNDKALRVVSGTASSGGATAFSSVFGAGKTAGATTLTESQMPSHTHTSTGTQQSSGYNDGWAAQGSSTAVLTHTTGAKGGGASHNHTLSLDLQYLDVIVATKD